MPLAEIVGAHRGATETSRPARCEPRRTAVQGLGTAMLILILAWAPLPYASNRPWSWSLLATAVAFMLLLAAAGPARGRVSALLPVSVLAAGLCVLTVGLWAWLQTVPAAGLPGWIAPHPLWHEVELAGLAPAQLPGLGVEHGRDALLQLVTYGGTFWTAFLLLGNAACARRVLGIFVGVVTLYATYGLINHFAGWETVLWEDEFKANPGFVTSTFINRNNFATYVNLGILAVIVLLLEPFLRAGNLGDLRRKAVETVQKLLDKRGPLLLVLVLLVSASLLTASRGGLASLVVALVVLVLMVLLMTRPPLVVLAPTAALGCITIWALVWTSGDVLLDRLNQGQDAVRLPIYEDTLDMIAARPVLGHGYGSYADAISLYRNRSAGPFIIDKAHNTYLEHAAELGIPATVLLYLAPLLLFLFCLRGAFVRRKEKIYPLLAVSATVLVAVHSLVDFSLQIPAVAVTHAMILGMGTAQSMPSPRPSGPGASLR